MAARVEEITARSAEAAYLSSCLKRAAVLSRNSVSLQILTSLAWIFQAFQTCFSLKEIEKN